MGLTSEGDTNLDVDSGFTIDLTTNLINHRGETNIVLHMVGGDGDAETTENTRRETKHQITHTSE